MLLEILTMLGIVFLGFVVSELIAAYFNKQTRDTSKVFFSYIGIVVTQKDFLRLLMSFGLGACILIFMENIIPYVMKITGIDIDGKLIYLITGISPTTIIFLAKKKFKEKTGLKESDLNKRSDLDHVGNRPDDR